MVLQAIVWTVLAWVAGLLLDANLSLQPAGFLCLRVLLQILAMGLCILRRHCLRAVFCLRAVTSENFLRRLTKR